MSDDDFDRALQDAFALTEREASKDVAFVAAWRRRRLRRRRLTAAGAVIAAVALAALVRSTAPWFGAAIGALGDQALQAARWDAMAAAALLVALIAAVSSVIVRPR